MDNLENKDNENKEVILSESLKEINDKLLSLNEKKDDLQKKLGSIREKIESIKEEETLLEEHMKILLREEANLNDLLEEEKRLSGEKERIENELGQIAGKMHAAEDIKKKITES